MAKGKLIYDVDANTSQARSKMSSFASKVGSLGKTAALGFAAVGTTIAAVAKQGAEDYSKQAEVVAELDAQAKNQFKTLKDVGKTSKEISQHFQDQASKMQEMTTFGDEIGIKGLTNLSTFQLTGKEIEKLTGGMYDMVGHLKGANASAEDFMGVSNMIGKAISTGQFAGLKKVGLAIDENKAKEMAHASQAEKVAFMAKVMKENYGGTAKALAQTPTGKLKQMSNMAGDISEQVGQVASELLVKIGPWLIKGMKWIAKIVTDVIKWMNGTSKTKEFLVQMFKTAGQILGTVIKVVQNVWKWLTHSKDVKNLLNNIWNIVKPIWNMFKSLWKIVDGIAKSFGGWGVIFKRLTQAINLMLAPIKWLANAGSWVLDKIAGAFGGGGSKKRHATGGEVNSGMWGEAGSEFMVNKGQGYVATRRELVSVMKEAGASGGNNHVYLDGNKIGESLARKVGGNGNGYNYYY